MPLNSLTPNHSLPIRLASSQRNNRSKIRSKQFNLLCHYGEQHFDFGEILIVQFHFVPFKISNNLNSLKTNTDCYKSTHLFPFLQSASRKLSFRDVYMNERKVLSVSKTVVNPLPV